VTFAGEVDIATAEQFRESIQRACAMRHTVVEVNLSEVSFIDSSGIGLVAELLRHQRQHGGRVVLRAARPSVARTFELCALDKASDVEMLP
jgi:anti-sigma B factor antagonist